MRVAVTGSSGLIGTALIASLERDGHDVLRVQRGTHWDPTTGRVDRAAFEGLDAVETRHPSHDGELRSRLTDIALRLGLLRTGGSDWHGDPEPGATHGALGSQEVPLEWLERLEQVRAARPAAVVG